MVWIFSQDKIPPLRLETLGLRLMSLREDPWKPTTYALQLFGGYARKNKVDLSPDQARIFISGTSQEMIAEVDEGYVVVTFQGGVLGCGLCLHGLLVSQIPKERRMKDVIESDSINL
jgi:NOL1/NOP2/fmu family ribosome biogenesis protein